MFGLYMSIHKQTFHRVYQAIKPDRRYLFAGIACAIAVALMSALLGYVSKLLLNLMASGGHRTVTPGELHRLDILSVAIVAVYAFQWPITYGQSVFFAESGARLGLRLRNQIYEHLQGLSLAFFNRQRTGALMSTINNDVPLLQGTIGGLKDFAPSPFRILFGLGICIHISWKLTIVAMLIVPAMSYSINQLAKRIRKITTQTQDKLADLNTLMEETLSGIRVIQSFSAQSFEVARFRRENQAAKDLSMYANRVSAKLKPTVDLVGAAGVASAMWVGVRLVIGHEMSFGNLGFFVLTLNQIAVGINGLGSAKVTWEQVVAASDRIFTHVLSIESDVQDKPDAIDLGDVTGKVTLESVAFSYHEHTPVLRDISFEINTGQVVALVGRSGAGKSTIADLIPRFYDVTGGRITVDGHDIRDVKQASLRKHIGIVPQESMLFGGTIRDNIRYGNPEATDEMVVSAAKSANAHEFITDPAVLPKGYDTIVGERGKQLSGGQRQRIAIARALLKDPRILILDEATSSLDAKSELVVQEALVQLMQGRTTLVIAHRLSTIINADKILVLEGGRVVERGTHDELMQLGGYYSDYYRRRLAGDATVEVG